MTHFFPCSPPCPSLTGQCGEGDGEGLDVIQVGLGRQGGFVRGAWLQVVQLGETGVSGAGDLPPLDAAGAGAGARPGPPIVRRSAPSARIRAKANVVVPRARAQNRPPLQDGAARGNVSNLQPLRPDDL